MSTDTQQAPEANNGISPLHNAIADAIEGVEPASDTGTETTGQGAAAAQQVQELPELEAPAMWDAETKAAWKALHSPTARAHLERLHKQWAQTQGYVTKIEQERATLRKQYDPLNEFLSPYARQWATDGLDVLGGLRQTMAWRDLINQHPREALIQLAQLSNIDLQELVAEQPYVDPQYQALQSEVQQLREQSRKQEQTWQQQQQHQHQQYALSQAQAFEHEKDAQGNLKHPHFRAVVNGMFAINQAMRAMNPEADIDMEQVYQLAVQAHPQLREEAAKRAQQQLIEQTQATNSRVAQVVAKSGVAKQSPARGADGGMDLKDSIRAAMNATTT